MSAAPASTQNNSERSRSTPPVRFMGDNIAAVAMLSDLRGFCAEWAAACVRTNGKGQSVIFVPNPCDLAFYGEEYAFIMCHEKGHTLGWTAIHEE
jgi:hypothetical protein